ncbi:MAG: LCP family protein [Anaerolineae bacterium]|nr:LCP family protein [Anaerolineae bacterium]
MGSDGESIRMQLEALFSEADILVGEDFRQQAILSSLIRFAPEAIVLGDLEGRRIYANRACHELFGYNYERQEMNGLSLSDLWPAERAMFLSEQVLPHARSGGWQGEVLQRRKDNTLFEATLSIFPVADRDERPVCLAAIVRDVSALKAAEREREQAGYTQRAQKIEAIAEIAQELATAPTLDELYRRAVTSIKERFGYEQVHIFSCFPAQREVRLIRSTAETAPLVLPYGEGIVGRVAAEGRAVSVPDAQSSCMAQPELSQNGSEIAVPVRWRGQVVGVLDVRTDRVTAISRDDELLLLALASQIAAAAENLRSLEEAHMIRRFAHASDGIGWVTLEGHLFIYANPILAGILHETRPEDLFGKPITAYYPRELHERVEKEVFPTVMREGRWSGELEFLSVRGERVPTIQSLFLIRDQDGKPLYIADVVTDISEQKRAGRLLARRARHMACINDIGRRIEQSPPVPEFLTWAAERIPQAMEHPNVCKVAIEYDGEVYGTPEALALPDRITESLKIGDLQVGRLCVSSIRGYGFLDDERALIRDVAGQIAAFIESQQLLEQSLVPLEELAALHRRYIHRPWVEPETAQGALPVSLQPETAQGALPVSLQSEPVQRTLPVGLQPDDTPPILSRREPPAPEPEVQEGHLPGRLREMWRRITTGLFILGILVLGGLLLSRVIHQAEAKSAPAVVTVAPFGGEKTRPVTVGFPTPFFTATPVPVTPSPTHFVPAFPTALPLSPTPTSESIPELLEPTPIPVALVVPDPFPVPGPNQYVPSTTLLIPTPVQPVPVAADAINIAVLGSDKRPDWTEWHTDVVQIVSIQRERGTVSIISIPRDLYVYIPGFWMSRVNFADYYGEAYDYPGGGPQLLRDTLLYNLGIRVDYYARTNFDGLIGIVDTIGGIDVPVHCRLSDHWPYPNEHGEYPVLTLEPGMHHMDGETALWYARSRLTTSVFSRERRQQQVLQAIWRKARDTGLLTRVPALWKQVREMVETDLPFSQIVELARIALALDEEDVRFYNIDLEEVTPWITPYGGRVYLPRWEAIEPVIAEAMAPAPETRLSRTYTAVEVWNGTSNQGWDMLAVDRLHRAGFPAVIGEPDHHDYSTTQMIVFGSPKGSGADHLQELFGLSDEQVIRMPDGKSAHPIRLIIGADYQTCPEQWR